MTDDSTPSEFNESADEDPGLTGQLEALSPLDPPNDDLPAEESASGLTDGEDTPVDAPESEVADTDAPEREAPTGDAPETESLPSTLADEELSETTVLPVAPSDVDVDPEGQTVLLPVGESTDPLEFFARPPLSPPDGLSDEEAAALAAASLPAGAVPVSQDTGAIEPVAVDLGTPTNVDMGPEKQGRWWLWTIVTVLVLCALGGAGYGWWWFTSRPINVPDIVGKQAAEAAQIFNDVGLRVGESSEEATDSAPVGTIVSQKPEAGSVLKPGDRVSFVTALPPTMTKVPDVNGKETVDAQTALAVARLRPYIVESFNSSSPVGYVISQLPTVGVELEPGAPVVLVVSTGPVPATTSVPRLVGLPEGDSGKLAAASNLRPYFYRSYDPSITAGTVATQSPLPGVAAPYDSPVQVWVSLGPGTATVVIPDVAGLTVAAATKAMKDKGLRTEAKTVSHSTVPKGQVISQMPSKGAKVIAGARVGLLVSRGASAEAMVPSLVGTSSAGVAAAITKAGFAPFVVDVAISQTATGTVFMQYPPAGTSQLRGLPVVCLVAMGRPSP